MSAPSATPVSVLCLAQGQTSDIALEVACSALRAELAATWPDLRFVPAVLADAQDATGVVLTFTFETDTARHISGQLDWRGHGKKGSGPKVSASTQDTQTNITAYRGLAQGLITVSNLPFAAAH